MASTCRVQSLTQVAYVDLQFLLVRPRLSLIDLLQIRGAIFWRFILVLIRSHILLTGSRLSSTLVDVQFIGMLVWAVALQYAVVVL